MSRVFHVYFSKNVFHAVKATSALHAVQYVIADLSRDYEDYTEIYGSPTDWRVKEVIKERDLQLV